MRTRRTPRAWAYGRAAITAAALGLALAGTAAPVGAEDAPAPAVRPGPVPGTIDAPWPPEKTLPLARGEKGYRLNEFTLQCMRKVACMQDAFMAVTLDNPHEPRPAGQEIITKWAEPVRIIVLGYENTPNEERLALERTLNNIIRIARSAGVDLEVARSESDIVNYFFLVSDNFVRDRDVRFNELLMDIFQDREKMHRKYDDITDRVRNRDFKCSGLLYQKSGLISIAFSLIPTHHESPMLRRCFYEEILQGLGVLNDFIGPHASLFADGSNHFFADEGSKVPTLFDLLLLRLLYHPDIRPGMDRAALLPVFASAYADVVPPFTGD